MSTSRNLVHAALGIAVAVLAPLAIWFAEGLATRSGVRAVDRPAEWSWEYQLGGAAPFREFTLPADGPSYTLEHVTSDPLNIDPSELRAPILDIYWRSPQRALNAGADRYVRPNGVAIAGSAAFAEHLRPSFTIPAGSKVTIILVGVAQPVSVILSGTRE